MNKIDATSRARVLPPLESLYRDFAPSVLRLGRSWGLDADEADDLVQQTFVRIVAVVDRIDPARPFGAYVTMIARNVLRNRRRDTGTARRFAGTARELDEERRTGDAQDYSVAIARFADHVLGLLHALPAAHREALVAVRIEGRSYEETAARLGRTEAAVRQDVSRAVRELCKAVGVEPAPGGTGGPCPWCADE